MFRHKCTICREDKIPFLKMDCYLKNVLFTNSLADEGVLLITAFQRHFVFKSGIFGSLEMVHLCRNMSETRL